MQKLGQYFLTNKSALAKIAAVLEIKDGNTIVEIGPGHGELTGELLKATSDKGQVKIIAIEKDPALAQALRENFKFQILNSKLSSETQNINPEIEIMEGDVRKILPALSAAFQLKAITYKLVGNIPYYLTGYLLRVIGELENKPEICVFTVQKEVAERIAAQPPRLNKLAASVQLWAKPEIIQILSARDFRPAPKVGSATVKLESKIWNSKSRKQNTESPSDDETSAPERLTLNAKRYYEIVKVLFRQPRKTILNNLSAGLKLDRGKTEELCRKSGVTPDDRPQNLSVEQIIRLAQLAAKAGIMNCEL